MSYLPLRTVKYICDEFEKIFDKYSIQIYSIDNFRKVVLIEDSLALYIGIEKDDMPVCLNAQEIYAWTLTNKFMDIPIEDGDYYKLNIEELNYNSLGLKHNHAKFIRKIEEITRIPYLSIGITYTKFRGYTQLYWCTDVPTLTEKLNTLLPELRLRERYEAWEGLNYYLIIIELEHNNGNLEYAVTYTTQNPHNYIVSKCKDCIKTGIISGEMRWKYMDFQEAFKSWKGKCRQERLEKYMNYFYFEKQFKEKDNIWKYCDQILENAYKGMYSLEERSTYTRPVNKWISEELVFLITKKLYKGFNVIYQHRPFFLRSSKGGQMSYDIFISGLNIAIEYQGKQHFEAIEYFGGEEALKNTQQRDKKKLELSIQNNIQLIYINYWEVITPKLIQEKIQEVLQKKN